MRRRSGFSRSLIFRAAAASITLAGGAAWGEDLAPALGKALFERVWVPAPSSTKANDGLGPLFNARACVQCHAAATAGRIETSSQGQLRDRGAVVRLSTTAGGGDPVWGAQVQTRAIQGHEAEARVRVSWETSRVTLGDGTPVDLRRPIVALEAPAFGELAAGVTASLLLAPSLRVAGQIARVDRDALGKGGGGAVLGRVSRGPDGAVLVFGRKATQADARAAIAMAFSRDLGMSTERLPFPAGDCTPAERACQAGPHGDADTGVEISGEIIAALADYVTSLPAPAQGTHDAGGAALFSSLGCAACHTPALPDRDGRPVRLYSDLSLHDMGADLAGVAEANAAMQSEWRTSPLLGLDERLAAGSPLLHDGRARSIEEAVLWHGGAALDARDAYMRLSADERRRLLSFAGSR